MPTSLYQNLGTKILAFLGWSAGSGGSKLNLRTCFSQSGLIFSTAVTNESTVFKRLCFGLLTLLALRQNCPRPRSARLSDLQKHVASRSAFPFAVSFDTYSLFPSTPVRPPWHLPNNICCRYNCTLDSKRESPTVASTSPPRDCE